jgi:outer membrane protein assembly factor BamD (BamD/ComL family)
MTRYPLFIFALFLTLLGSGCAGPPRLVSLWPPPVDQQLFATGLDQLAQTSTPEAFERLRQQHPQSLWTERAIQIQRLVNERDKQTRQATRQRQELARLQLQTEQLERDKSLLQNDIAKLKQLLIDNELRTR